MNRWPALFVAVLLFPAAIPMTFGTPAATPHEANTTGVQPGAAVSSVLGVQRATIDRPIEAEAFQTRLETAETPASRARVIADAVNRTETRLTSLESRLDALQAAKANGSIGSDTYATRVASVAASARSLDTLVDRIQASTDDLDTETLREAGVTRDRIETLQARIDRVVAADEGAIAVDDLDQEFYRRIAAVAKVYNNRVTAYDLGVLGSHLNGERINLLIVRSDGTTDVISFRTTEDTRVRDLRAGPHPDASLRVRIEESTARGLLTSDNPGEAVNRAFRSGAIEVKGLDPSNAIRWRIANTIIDVVRVFAGSSGLLFPSL